MRKMCKTCEEEKEIAAHFYRKFVKGKVYPSSECKECTIRRSKEWREQKTNS